MTTGAGLQMPRDRGLTLIDGGDVFSSMSAEMGGKMARNMDSGGVFWARRAFI
jgi:hypothetical protein